jgi:hypothetical protein
MNTKIFFSKQGEGWFEFDIPLRMRESTEDDLRIWAYKTIEQYRFKSFLISENPHPYPL